MAFQGLTPESLVERSDSKNPATTCKGLTATGRPCRRALASTPNQSPTPSPLRNTNGVVAILDEGDAAAFFCYQHKGQAENLVAKLEQQRRTRILPLAKKSSVDTLIEKVGVLDLDDELEQRKKHSYRQNMPYREPQRVKKRDTLPQEWRAMHGPLMSVPEEIVASEMPANASSTHTYQLPHRNEQRFGRSNVRASWSCCIQADDEEDIAPRRHKNHQRSRTSTGERYAVRPANDAKIVPHQSDDHIQRNPVKQPAMQQQGKSYPSLSKYYGSQGQAPARPTPRPVPSSVSPPHSETVSFLSLIQPHLSPTTTSALLAELSKPISEADEAGYIYIFWLTPESEASKPDDETASSLLDDDDFDVASPSPSSQRNSNQRRETIGRSAASNNRTLQTNQALQRYASIKRRPSEPRKILLKIGRANNVYRRLSQWTKQCGQNITLVRYYPYHRDAAASQSSPAGSMVPHVHKVERLIHLELADQRAVSKGPCEQCGREHKEWFEVEATRQAVKNIDQTIRRWVAWVERTG